MTRHYAAINALARWTASMLWATSLVVPPLAAQSNIKRLLCPMVLTNVGCVRFQLATKPTSTGGTTITAIIQNLQAPRFSGDPSYSVVGFIELLAPVGTPSTTGPTYGQSWVGYYGTVLNPVGPAANQWVPFVDPGSTTDFGWFDFIPGFNANPLGLGGCTRSGGSGYQTCINNGFGALVLQYDVEQALTASSFTSGLIAGNGYSTNLVRDTPWACNPFVLGDTDAGFVNTGSCDVSDFSDDLAVGPLAFVVTPEPGTLAMCMTPLLALCAATRRRRLAQPRRGRDQSR